MLPTIGEQFYLVETADKQDRPAIDAGKNSYHESNGGSEDVGNGDDGWKNFDEYGQDYESQNDKQKRKKKRKKKSTGTW